MMYFFSFFLFFFLSLILPFCVCESYSVVVRHDYREVGVKAVVVQRDLTLGSGG
jgi:hypothetical protein